MEMRQSDSATATLDRPGASAVVVVRQEPDGASPGSEADINAPKAGSGRGEASDKAWRWFGWFRRDKPAVTSGDQDKPRDATRTDVPVATPKTTKPARAKGPSLRQRFRAWRQRRRDARRNKQHARAQRMADSASPLVWKCLFWGLVIACGASFWLSFHGLWGFAAEALHLHPYLLAPMLPIANDGLTICGIAALFALRHAPWHIRAYCWLVFFVPIAISIAGNVAYLDSATQASRPSVLTAGIAAPDDDHDVSRIAIGVAAAPPILLALGTHMLVLVARQNERSTATARATQPVAVATPPPRRAAPPPAAEPMLAPAVATPPAAVAKPRRGRNPAAPSAPKATKRATGMSVATPTPVKAATADDDGGDTDAREYARDRAVEGATVREIYDELVELGCAPRHRRSVERWTADIRHAQQGAAA